MQSISTSANSSLSLWDVPANSQQLLDALKESIASNTPESRNLNFALDIYIQVVSTMQPEAQNKAITGLLEMAIEHQETAPLSAGMVYTRLSNLPSLPARPELQHLEAEARLRREVLVNQLNPKAPCHAKLAFFVVELGNPAYPNTNRKHAFYAQAKALMKSNDPEAAIYFKLAKDQGHSTAAEDLKQIVCTEKPARHSEHRPSSSPGKATESNQQNHPKAILLLEERAQTSDDPKDYIALGEYYEKTGGDEPLHANSYYEKAYQYFDKAERHGRIEGILGRLRIKLLLDPDNLAAAQKLEKKYRVGVEGELERDLIKANHYLNIAKKIEERKKAKEQCDAVKAPAQKKDKPLPLQTTPSTTPVSKDTVTQNLQTKPSARSAPGFFQSTFNSLLNSGDVQNQEQLDPHTTSLNALKKISAGKQLFSTPENLNTINEAFALTQKDRSTAELKKSIPILDELYAFFISLVRSKHVDSSANYLIESEKFISLADKFETLHKNELLNPSGKSHFLFKANRLYEVTANTRNNEVAALRHLKIKMHQGDISAKYEFAKFCLAKKTPTPKNYPGLFNAQEKDVIKMGWNLMEEAARAGHPDAVLYVKTVNEEKAKEAAIAAAAKTAFAKQEAAFAQAEAEKIAKAAEAAAARETGTGKAAAPPFQPKTFAPHEDL